MLRELTVKDLPPVLATLADISRSSGIAVYLVGGSVRDFLLGRKPKDLDFLVFGPTQHLARAIASHLGGKPVFLGREGKAVWRVVGADFELDLTPPRGPDLASDLRARDFTINAMAWSLNTGRLLDEVGGLSDLDCGLVRMTHSQSFQHDPIRILRAFRLAAILGFQVEPATLARLEAEKALLREAAPERIRQEMLDILDFHAAYACIVQMHSTGVLEELLHPAGLTKTESNLEWNSGTNGRDHSVAAVGSLERLLRCMEHIFPKCHTAEVFRWLHRPRHTALVKLALLLHSSGKPKVGCRGIGRPVADQRGLEETSGRIAADTAVRLGLSNREKAVLVDLVAKQGLPFRLLPLWRSGRLTERAMLRVFLEAGSNAPGLLLHAFADFDALAAQTGGGGGSPELLDLAHALLDTYVGIFLPRQNAPRLITGADLKERGLPPGPLYSEILAKAESARIEGDIRSREQALEWLRHALAPERREND